MMKKLALREWAKGKNLFLVIFAESVALSAEACYEACLTACEKKNLDGTTEIPWKEWRGFYAHPGRTRGKCYDVVLGEEGREEFRQFFDACTEWQRVSKRRKREAMASMNPATVQRVQREAVKAWERVWEQHNEDIRRELDGEWTAPVDWRERLRTPEVLFYFRVLFPCWILYGESLNSLMLRARKGDPEAMEKILRLDSGALNVASVDRHFKMGMQDPIRKKQFTDALRGKPRRKVTRQKVKVALAALILKASGELDAGLRKAQRVLRRHKMEFRYPKTRLESPDVRALFDAVAKDLRGELQDNDLPQGDHALYMAMKRELGFWSGYL